MSTPTSVELPEGVRRIGLRTSRGTFAALDARPEHGVCERRTALLVPGYTGSKEDFLAVLHLLAAAGRRVLAIDMRGQYQTPGAAGGYSPAALSADIAAIVHATGARHLLGHSYGGLVTRDAVLDDLARDEISSFTLMSSGPGALTGPRAEELRRLLDALAGHGPAELWETQLEPQAAAAGVSGTVLAFLRDRFLSNDQNAMAITARNLLTAQNRTDELAKLTDLPMLVLYGEDDNAWSPSAQEEMAIRIGARRVCVPGAAHSPNVEAPATTASALTSFWDAAESPAR